MLGRIKWYDERTQFGFITGEDNQDYSFRGEALKMKEPPREGMAIEFSPLPNEEAENILRLAWFNRIFFPDLDVNKVNEAADSENIDKITYNYLCEDKFIKEYCDNFWIYQDAPEEIKPPYYP